MGDGAASLYQERVRTLTRTLPIALYIAEPEAGFRGPRALGQAIGGSLGFRSRAFQLDTGLWVSRIHPDDIERVQKASRDAEKTGLLSTKYRWRCAHGVEKLFLDRGIIVSAPDSNNRNLIGVCFDLTDTGKLARLLRQYIELGIVVPPSGETTQEDILHDLNNLLTVIIWNLERAVWQMNGAQTAQAKSEALETALATALVGPQMREPVLDDGTNSATPYSRLVLVVEDDPDVRAVTVARLEDMGHHVLDADNAKSALHILADEPSIDLLLTDINLTIGMNGFELARQAQEIEPCIKVLFVSGFRPSRAQEQELKGEILMKPYRREQLAAALARAFTAISPSRAGATTAKE